MARRAKIDSDTLISLIDQFYAEKCDGNTGLLKIPQIGEYVRSKDYDVADYLIRRSDDAIAYIKKLQESTEETHVHTVAVYRDLDMDAFLMKNNTKEKIKVALKERENYYREITNSATYSFKENKRLEQQVNELKVKNKKLEEELESLESKGTNLGKDNRNYKAENQKLREIIKTYVYPEIANELLKKQGLLKDNPGVIKLDELESEIATAETDITGIKSNIVKGLFDSI